MRARNDERVRAVLASSVPRVRPVFFDEPGCDNLHWLDDTVYRPCCDDHDRCYRYYGCAQWSWWYWETLWGCTQCNLEVVQCFSDISCALTGGQWCP